MEKLDLCAKRLSPVRRHHQSPPRQEDHGTSWTIQNPRVDHQELLVAIHSVRCLAICRRVPTMSTSKDEKGENPCPTTTNRHPQATLGTHHCRLHHWTTDIPRIQCNNGSRQLIYQVRHVETEYREMLFQLETEHSDKELYRIIAQSRPVQMISY